MTLLILIIINASIIAHLRNGFRPSIFPYNGSILAATENVKEEKTTISILYLVLVLRESSSLQFPNTVSGNINEPNMILLYSINSWISYKIAENYFQNKHYVWCAPNFNAIGVNPPSSDPCEIYNGLSKDILGKDFHSAKISMNKAGLLKAAEIKLEQKIISVIQRDEIVDIIKVAQIDDFRPLIYVIPYEQVKNVAQPVSIKLKANTFSKEFVIEQLERSQFDIIDILKTKDMYDSIKNISELPELTEIIHYVIKILNKHRSKLLSEINKLEWPSLPKEANLKIANALLAEIDIANLGNQDEKIDSHINSLFEILNERFESKKSISRISGKDILEKFRKSS